MGNARLDEFLAFCVVADRLVERNRRSLCVQYDLQKAALACFRFDCAHQFGADTTATGSGQHSDALGLTGISLRMHASGAHGFPVPVGEEMQAGCVETVELVFARNALFLDEHDAANLVAGVEFRTRRALDDVDVNLHDSQLSAPRGRCFDIGDACDLK